MIKIKESDKKFEQNPNKISIFTTRTEQEILKDFEALGYINVSVKGTPYIRLRIYENDIPYDLVINKEYKHYSKHNAMNFEICPITMQEHKLLNELFTLWGWL